jgi:Ca2+-transporting ATPase
VVRWGRSVYANIQKFIQFQLTVNVAALIINIVAAVSSGNVPLNAVQVCINICSIYFFFTITAILNISVVTLIF